MVAPGATILGCAGPRLTDAERRFFADADPWGFILFDRNLADADQIRALTAELRHTVGRDAPILIDQEGGRVQRLRPPLARDWSPPLDQVRAAGPRDAAHVLQLRYSVIAAELGALGIDVNCAPIADIADDTTHPILRNRCYGTELGEVVANARGVADGLLAGGVLPVLKHIPGHGRARADSHLELPVVDDPAETLRARDFAAFAALADLPMAMTAHIVYPALDPENPATQSATLIRLIRDEIGFGGLLMSDDISMDALAGTVAERSARAIAAGCDVILHCNGELAEMEAVAAAAGRMTGAAETRARDALVHRGAAEPVDIAALEADLSALMSGPVHG